MGRLAFIPVSIATGLAAGLVSRKAFEAVWGLIDDQEPPESGTRDTNWPKLLAALAVQGAVFSITRGAIDHAARRAFFGATGQWPGEERPDPA